MEKEGERNFIPEACYLCNHLETLQFDDLQCRDSLYAQVWEREGVINGKKATKNYVKCGVS